MPNVWAIGRMQGNADCRDCMDKISLPFSPVGEIEMCNCIRQRLGWALAIITIWGTSNAAWGQESQTPPAATGQYAAPAQAQQGGDQLSYDDIRGAI